MNTTSIYCTSNTTLRPAKASIDLDKARKMLEDAKGKVAPLPRYNVSQLNKMDLKQLVRLILLLQDENERLRAELEKMRMKAQLSDKKG